MPDDKSEWLRTEYAALTSYYNSVVSFRLTLLGFFIAGISLILGGNKWPIPREFSFLGIGLTLSLWLFEIRNRVLFYHLAKRAVYIERHYSEVDDNEEVAPFFSRQFPSISNPNDPSAEGNRDKKLFEKIGSYLSEAWS